MIKKIMSGYKLVDARIKFPFCLLVAGISNSGKTQFCLQLILHKNRIFDKQIDYIWWFYGQKTTLIDELKDYDIKTHFGLPEDFDTYIQPGKKGLFVIDDLIRSCSSSPLVSDLFTAKSHHENIGVVLVSQNFYHEGKERKNILRNSQYLCLFPTPLDQSMIYSLASRILPRHQRVFFDIFEYVTSRKPYSYLFIDGASTHRELRFRSNLFDEVQKVYIPHQWILNQQE